MINNAMLIHVGLSTHTQLQSITLHNFSTMKATCSSEVNPIPVKAAMKEIGYDCGGCRLPLCAMKQENLTTLRKLLK